MTRDTASYEGGAGGGAGGAGGGAGGEGGEGEKPWWCDPQQVNKV